MHPTATLSKKKAESEGLWFIMVHAVPAPKGLCRLDFIYFKKRQIGAYIAMLTLHLLLVKKVLLITQILFFLEGGVAVVLLTINKGKVGFLLFFLNLASYD